jgi:hypothetical protein
MRTNDNNQASDFRCSQNVSEALQDGFENITNGKAASLNFG